jgi:hypothetical protein
MSDPRITDEAVEAAARSLNRNLFNDPQQADWQEVVRGTARAALEAALPHLAPQSVVDREAIAAVLREHMWIPSESRCSCGDEYIEFVSHHQAEAVLALLNGGAK